MTDLKRPTVEVPIYQGDDLATLKELRRRAEVAVRREAMALARLGDKGSTDLAEIQAEHDTFAAEAAERAVMVTLTALGRRQWRSLVAAHPPRDGNEGDKALGANEDTFGDALVAASIVAPTFDTPADREAFLDALTDAQFDRLFFEAYQLNRSEGVDPKASLGSELILRNGAI